MIELIEGDCRSVLKELPDQTVNCIITSPPYFGLRDYEVDGQMGAESTPTEFVSSLVSVLREARRVLRDDGTLWLNLGDTYTPVNYGKQSKRRRDSAGSENTVQGKGGYWHSDRDGARSDQMFRGARDEGYKQKDLMGMPWRVAFALQEDGWYLRQDIIWHKPNPMPESVRDRCTKAHEYIFLLSKSSTYYFDWEAMQEPAVKGASGSEFHTGKTGEHQLGRASQKPRKAGNKNHKYVTEYEASETEEHRTKAGLMKVAEKEWLTRNRRSVWTVATKPFKEAHFATFPPDLIEPCVLAGCPEGGTVLDPFFGAGTTGVVCQKTGRNAIGIELNPEYFDIAARRLGLDEPIAQAAE